MALPFNLHLTRRPWRTAHHLTTRSKYAAPTTWFTTPCTNQNTLSDSPIQPSQPHPNHVPKTFCKRKQGLLCCQSWLQRREQFDANYPSTNRVSSSSPITNTDLSLRYLKQIHLRLCYCPKIAIQKYLCSAGQWSPLLLPPLEQLVQSCACTLSAPLASHALVLASPPSSLKQQRSQIDVIFFHASSFIHVIDLATLWSELGRLRALAMSDQCSTFSLHIDL